MEGLEQSLRGLAARYLARSSGRCDDLEMRMGRDQGEWVQIASVDGMTENGMIMTQFSDFSLSLGGNGARTGISKWGN